MAGLPWEWLACGVLAALAVLRLWGPLRFTAAPLHRRAQRPAARVRGVPGAVSSAWAWVRYNVGGAPLFHHRRVLGQLALTKDVVIVTPDMVYAERLLAAAWLAAATAEADAEFAWRHPSAPFFPGGALVLMAGGLFPRAVAAAPAAGPAAVAAPPPVAACAVVVAGGAPYGLPLAADAAAAAALPLAALAPAPLAAPAAAAPVAGGAPAGWGWVFAEDVDSFSFGSVVQVGPISGVVLASRAGRRAVLVFGGGVSSMAFLLEARKRFSAFDYGLAEHRALSIALEDLAAADEVNFSSPVGRRREVIVIAASGPGARGGDVHGRRGAAGSGGGPPAANAAQRQRVDNGVAVSVSLLGPPPGDLEPGWASELRATLSCDGSLSTGAEAMGVSWLSLPPLGNRPAALGRSRGPEWPVVDAWPADVCFGALASAHLAADAAPAAVEFPEGANVLAASAVVADAFYKVEVALACRPRVALRRLERVGDLAALSLGPSVADQMKGAMVLKLPSRGLPIRGAFDGRRGAVSPASHRVWHLILAARASVAVPQVSARQLRRVVGRCAFLFMVGGPLLSVFSAVCRFISKSAGGPNASLGADREPRQQRERIDPAAFDQHRRTQLTCGRGRPCRAAHGSSGMQSPAWPRRRLGLPGADGPAFDDGEAAGPGPGEGPALAAAREARPPSQAAVPRSSAGRVLGALFVAVTTRNKFPGLWHELSAWPATSPAQLRTETAVVALVAARLIDVGQQLVVTYVVATFAGYLGSPGALELRSPASVELRGRSRFGASIARCLKPGRVNEQMLRLALGLAARRPRGWLGAGFIWGMQVGVSRQTWKGDQGRRAAHATNPVWLVAQQAEATSGLLDDEASALRKRRALGNVKFVGQLILRGMLSAKLLITCSEELLGCWQECGDALESLAALLPVACPTFDAEAWPLKRQLDAIFSRMSELAATPAVPPRTRFLLRDVLDLRVAGWPSRSGAAAKGPAPMTLEQVRGSQASGDCGSGGVQALPAACAAARAGGPPRSARSALRADAAEFIPATGLNGARMSKFEQIREVLTGQVYKRAGRKPIHSKYHGVTFILHATDANTNLREPSKALPFLLYLTDTLTPKGATAIHSHSDNSVFVQKNFRLTTQTRADFCAAEGDPNGDLVPLVVVSNEDLFYLLSWKARSFHVGISVLDDSALRRDADRECDDALGAAKTEI
ncbi:unnamed protein product [Prorocentrum cordatum]|uniref:MIF4G domain-containing protein n=1 Tax=Prorocentrum cordatum TaxID=2364126 RepID=A0ABN9U3H7_9DINO|nr:unnamed protein product [Polarella glacialis]